MPLHAVFPIPPVCKHVYCLTYILFLATITSQQINQLLLITVKTVVDFMRPLVFITYKHVSFYYAVANLETTATTIV